ncbi:CHAT domain-containing protein [Aliifodinibius sp. S!AR15-10]|uniref:CHAT domain-containing protein n=1 Tax=Aliifodinibius sp. S!AR15-10 TaxID=2950437 RepID=UPI00285AC022|nr:CHAT domain-containing protein [Aliifodinibius sp. S!AR15-10]MDR8392108.1 CHAT domain-containing protein [Aliifodinibius sp. S!AR15-10]
MVLQILLLFVVGLLPQNTSTDQLKNQARNQTTHYLNQIEKEKNVDINLWALTALCENKQHEELLNFIHSQTPKHEVLKELKYPFCNYNSKSKHLEKLGYITSSPRLILSAVLEESNHEIQAAIYKKFESNTGQFNNLNVDYVSIIKNVIAEDSIGTDLLSTDFSFAHFQLLFKSKLLRKSFLTKIADTWHEGSTNLKTDSLEKSLFLVSLIRVLFLTDDYTKIHNLHSIIANEKLVPLSNIKTKVYRYWDYTMYLLGLYDKGLNILRNYSIPLSKFLKDKEEELNLLQTTGIYLYQIGKIQSAKQIYQEVLSRAQNQNLRVSKSSLYNNLSITHLKSGDFDRYLQFQFRSLDIAEKKERYDNQLEILRNLHVFYRRNGDINSSLRYINKALNLSKKYGNTRDLGSIYTSLGVFYRDLNSNPDSASYYFDKAKSVLNQNQNFNHYVILLRENARLYENNNEYMKAIGIYRDIKDFVKTQTQSPTYLDALIDEARILLKLGKLVQVEDILVEIENSDLSLLDFSEIIKAKALRAGYLIETEQKRQAYEIMKPAIEQIVEWAKNSTDLQSGFWNVEQEYINAFKLWVELLIDTNRPGEAVLALDQLKTINDAGFYQDPMVKSSQLNESELTQYRNLTQELDRLRKQQLSSDNNQQLDLQSRIDRLNAQKRALDRKITQYADRPTVNIDQIQQRLTSKDLIIHITELKNTYYFAQISRRNVKFQKVELDKSTRSLFEQAIQELSQGETDLNKLYQISEILELSNIPNVTENVIMIPDSYLFQLPIDILPAEAPSHNYSYGGTTYQIEQFRTEYLTSLNELVYGTETEKSFNWDYVGFGITDFSDDRSNLMPLPHAGKEVTQISRELTNLEAHRTMLEQNSTEDAFRQNAPKARVLHLATHSRVSEQDPLFSTIYMSAPENKKDQDQFNGQIFAYELFEMNLSNELIMLNSCESGSGSYLQGSGIVGISRALRYAGAESLVLNLWSVNDMMASDFAVEFYKAINKGDSKSEALRKAKIHFLKQKNANPHYWGPYMLIGSSRPIVQPQQSTNLLFAGGFLLYLVVMVGLSYTVQLRKDSHDLKEAA